MTTAPAARDLAPFIQHTLIEAGVTRERIVTRHETGTAAGPPFMRLPSRLTRLVGRDDDVEITLGASP